MIVTPCVGVWIEITSKIDDNSVVRVTPCVGVWIEIDCLLWRYVLVYGHSLRGSVD